MTLFRGCFILLLLLLAACHPYHPIAVAIPPRSPSQAPSLPPPPPPPPPQSVRQPTAARPPDSPRPTGRAWLVANQTEPQGFGLYSYLLFGSLPGPATRPAYVAAIKATIAKIEPIERKLESGYAPGQLNLLFIPVYDVPPASLTNDQLPDWVVDHYNFSRAQRMLAAVKGSGTGIYILSVLAKPPDVTSTLSPPYLWEDLTGVAPTIVIAWVQYFIDQSAKAQPWQSNTCEMLVLDLRNYIETLAGQAQLTIPAMITAIKWFSPGA